jgi:hypothetical protein
LKHQYAGYYEQEDLEIETSSDIEIDLGDDIEIDLEPIEVEL